MAIISFKEDEVVEYIPEYGDNRQSKEPCIVSLKFVPYSKVQFYSKALSHRTQTVKSTSDMVEAGHEVQLCQFIDSVEKVENFFVGSQEITDPNEFYKNADTELILEIIKAMESSDKLNKGLLRE